MLRAPRQAVTTANLKPHASPQPDNPGMADSDEEDEEVFTGLSRPTLVTGGGGGDTEDDDDDEEAQPAMEQPAAAEEEEEVDAEEPPSNLLPGADEAFEGGDADAVDLDPFKVAAALDVEAPQAAETSKAGGSKKQAWVPKGHISQRKLFVGGIPYHMDDPSLTKFFSRYGKIQEARVVLSEGGKPRGFGFVTFVSDKGSRYCMQQAGDPPKIEIEGRDCTVRPVHDREDRGQGHYLMPARGASAHLGESKARQERREREEEERQKRADAAGVGGSSMEAGIGSIAQAHRRAVADDEEAIEGEGGEEGAVRKRGKKRKDVTTITRRQDAEPLNKRPITMKEIFPKEFWRV